MTDPLLFRVLAAVVLVGASLFIAVFSREPWRRHPFGRSLMAMAVGIWLFALANTLRFWFGADYPARDLLRVTAYTAIAYAVWVRAFVLIHERRKRS